MSTLKLTGSSSGEAEVTVAAAAGTPTITLPTASINLATAGTDGQFLKTNGSGTLSFTDAPGGLFSNYALVVDQKTQATDGGDFVKDVWQTRALQTEYDHDGIVSISSNKFTLAAGNYLITWSCPAYKADKNTSRLYDVTNTAVISPVGSTEHAGTSTAIQVRSTGAARVTPSGSTEYRIEHKSAATRSGNGFGFAANMTSHPEIYTIVEIYKEA